MFRMTGAALPETNNKGEQFLKKQQGNLILSTELITKIGHHKEFQADISSISP